jgi:hypothetical protein
MDLFAGIAAAVKIVATLAVKNGVKGILTNEIKTAHNRFRDPSPYWIQNQRPWAGRLVSSDFRWTDPQGGGKGNPTPLATTGIQTASATLWAFASPGLVDLWSLSFVHSARSQAGVCPEELEEAKPQAWEGYGLALMKIF